MQERGRNNSGGGFLEGTVERIGWSDRFIIARRQSLSGGDPDGWMIIDLKMKTITGPFSDEEIGNKPEVSNIQTFVPSEAWNKL